MQKINRKNEKITFFTDIKLLFTYHIYFIIILDFVVFHSQDTYTGGNTLDTIRIQHIQKNTKPPEAEPPEASVKGKGGDLLSHIVLQYHRRARA